MLFYVFYEVLQCYNLHLGYRYLKKQTTKPKYKIIYYSSEEFLEPRKNMELAFEEYNMGMRIRLELFFRTSFVLGISVLLQTALIFSVLHNGLSVLFTTFQFFFTIQLQFTTFVAFKLLQIRNKEKTRHWRRGDSFIIQETHLNKADALKNDKDTEYDFHRRSDKKKPGESFGCSDGGDTQSLASFKAQRDQKNRFISITNPKKDKSPGAERNLTEIVKNPNLIKSQEFKHKSMGKQNNRNNYSVKLDPNLLENIDEEERDSYI